MMAVMLGETVIIMGRFDAADMFRVIQGYKCTHAQDVQVQRFGSIAVRDKLTCSPTGKLIKRKLNDQYWQANQAA